MLTEQVACKDKPCVPARRHSTCRGIPEAEAVWRGLHYLVFNTETSDRLKLRLFNASLRNCVRIWNGP